jgi:soluble lytic murein transglycosylase-like protein
MKRGGADTWLWVALGAAGVAYLIYKNKETIVSLGTDALAAGKELYFQATLSSDAQPYSDIILAVARDTGIDPFLIYAIGEQESRWGDALSPPGPGGTGDSGHGHGIMQIDDRSWGSWLASNDWTDPETNIRKGVEILKQALAFFSSNASIPGYTNGSLVSIDKSADRLGVAPGQYPDPRPLSGDALTAAALAAYNAGAGSVLMALAAGLSPDVVTANGRYSDMAMNRAAETASTFTSLVS